MDQLKKLITEIDTLSRVGTVLISAPGGVDLFRGIAQEAHRHARELDEIGSRAADDLASVSEAERAKLLSAVLLMLGVNSMNLQLGITHPHLADRGAPRDN